MNDTLSFYECRLSVEDDTGDDSSNPTCCYSYSFEIFALRGSGDAKTSS